MAALVIGLADVDAEFMGAKNPHECGFFRGESLSLNQLLNPGQNPAASAMNWLAQVPNFSK